MTGKRWSNTGCIERVSSGLSVPPINEAVKKLEARFPDL